MAEEGVTEWTLYDKRRYLAARTGMSEAEVEKLSWEELDEALAALPSLITGCPPYNFERYPYSFSDDELAR